MTPTARIAVWLGSGFGVGFLPAAPGTWGSLLALPMIWLCIETGGIVLLLVFTLAACLASWWATPFYEKIYGDDPGSLVIDEIAGQSLCLLLVLAVWNVEAGFLPYLLGFTFFRVFDITKILGGNRLQQLGSSPGVLLDDLLAGFYAHLATVFIILIIV